MLLSSYIRIAIISCRSFGYVPFLLFVFRRGEKQTPFSPSPLITFHRSAIIHIHYTRYLYIRHKIHYRNIRMDVLSECDITTKLQVHQNQDTCSRGM